MFDIKNTTRQKIPKIPFQKIAETVLGKKYELSLVFIGDQLSRKLNRQYRQIDKNASILSFPLTKNNGEIFINLNLAKKNSAKFDRAYNNFIAFLFIHGLTHLKGRQHSSKMEREEVAVRKKFNI